MPYLMLLLFVALLVTLVVLVPRWNELFLVSVRGGEVLLARGRCPTALLREIGEVVRRDGVQHATIRGVRDADAARLVVTGVEEGTAQRLRNTFRLHSISQLRAAPGPEAPNLGQVLGLVWLAWLLAGLTRRG